jgi:CubicO group peptidase (beta-lactamase class C family)
MNHFTTRVQLLFLSLLVLSFGYAQESTATNLTAELDGMLTKLSDSNLFSGSVLVAQNDTILLSKGYGLADREQNIPNTPQTIFRIEHITRQFTSMGIMILQAQGKMDVTDLACQHLSECPEGWEAFTIHDLLINALVEEQFYDPNAAYSVLGEIIANVSGQSYEDFMQTMIFDSLKMTHTTFILHQENEAVGYYSDTSDRPARYEDTTDVHAAAGLYSTVEDLYLWDQALYTEQLIPQELLEIALTPHIKIDNIWAHSYGYGWGIGQQDTHKVVGHGGYISGFSTRIFRYPDDKVTIIVLSNQESIDTQYIASLLSERVFGKE